MIAAADPQHGQVSLRVGGPRHGLTPRAIDDGVGPGGVLDQVVVGEHEGAAVGVRGLEDDAAAVARSVQRRTIPLSASATISAASGRLASLAGTGMGVVSSASALRTVVSTRASISGVGDGEACAAVSPARASRTAAWTAAETSGVGSRAGPAEQAAAAKGRAMSSNQARFGSDMAPASSRRHPREAGQDGAVTRLGVARDTR